MELKGVQVCDNHHKKCYFICIEKGCQVGKRLLCMKCVSSQQHIHHQILDFEDANKWILEKEKESLDQLNQLSLDIWREFSSSKQKINQLLESIELSLISILCPSLYKLKENLQKNNIFNIAQSLSEYTIQQVNNQHQIDLKFLQEKMNTPIYYLEELSNINNQLDNKLFWKQTQNLSGHEDVIYSMDLSPDGTRAVTGGGDMQIRVWDMVKYELISKPIQAHEGIVWCVAYGINTFVSGSDDNTIKFWEEKTFKTLEVKSTNDPVFSLEFNKEHTQLASGVNNVIFIWNVKEKSLTTQLKGHTDYVTSLAYYKQFLASGSKDKSVRLWNVETKQQINVFTGNSNTIRSVAFSDDGKYVASGGYDKIVRVWKQSSNELFQYNHGDIVWSVKFLNQDTLISGGKNAKIKFWPLDNNQRSEITIECQKGVMAMQITVNQNQIIAATNKDVCVFEKTQ